MELNKYQELSKRTLDKNKTDKEMLTECIVGLAEELGEALSPIKKYLFHNHELDRDKVIKELGDMMFYHSGICTLLDITLEEVAKANIEKLEKRYPQGFTQERSIHRECEHEWQYAVNNSNMFNPKFHRECRKCGKKGE